MSDVKATTSLCSLQEARPEDFVENKDRYYTAKGPKRSDRNAKIKKRYYSYGEGEGKGGREVRGGGEGGKGGREVRGRVKVL